MKTDFDDILQIRKFLNGELTVSDEKHLRTRANIDNNFEKLLEQEREIKKVMAMVERKSTIDRLKSVDENLSEENHFQFSDRFDFKEYKLFFSVAASIVLVLAIAWLWQVKATPTFEQICDNQIEQSLYEPDWNLRDVAQKKNFKKLFREQYDTEDYSNAIKTFEQISLHEITKEDRIANGYALLEIGRIEEARLVFVELNKLSSVYSERLEWYITLCLLRQGKIELAKEKLIKMKENPNHDYHTNAIKIFAFLDSKIAIN